MTDEKEKAIEKDQQTKTPAGAKKDEISEEELEKAAGGCHHTAIQALAPLQ